MSESSQPQGGGQPQHNQPEAPNNVAILVLGICSIVFCWTWGVVGIACGIIGLVMANKANKEMEQNPDVVYKGAGNVKAGKITSIIGLALSGLYLIYIIVVLLFFGSALMSLGSLQGL